ncbi:VCBS repeat-containing protein [[Phormidium] sp. ETS-05]|uniref:FG-GAP repeat domain-containing protein n=1 Tax=[Phormidium] sp. ETS-05 TaxID=222819 RepID=UPI0018EEE95C|nr:VCBS repeat-containing protein [[Phormidium] sp. ETS-05]
MGSSPFSVTSGDFNGDGHLDLAVPNDDSVSLLLGNGSGSFNPHTTFAVGSNPGSVTLKTSTAMATWT